ncbi:MAG: hypothetical protein ACO2PP_23355 [Thermocrinis sp.]|jgi:hypothetical protein|uniref:hypothetical protein n=1 Tax=Thermocrinis sp. TaxID=2024383 RepID=UPI003C112028
MVVAKDKTFLFYIFETLKSRDPTWATFVNVDGAYEIVNTNKQSGERPIVFTDANEFIKWCAEHGEVFLCERKREVYKNLKGLSKRNKWVLKAKLIAYYQLWWNR